ncbi:MAG: PAS domain S-box protein [Campylobacterota bacterium]|nr:PAS domain S-box protein [Campylobacterota bacterium]
MMVQIQDICSKNFALEKLYKTQKSNNTYLDIINQVAIVSKTDMHGNITYVNDIFCDVSGYSEDELMGTNQRIVRHQDMPTKLFDTLWDDLRAGKVWHGKIKNKAKDGSAYYVDASIFPMYDADESMSGWMAVRFLITEAEEEKQKFYKNVISNIKTYRQTQKQLEQKVVELESKQQIAQNIDLIQEKMLSEKEKSEKARDQLAATEGEVCELKDKLKYVVSSSNDKTRKLATKITSDKSTLEKQNKALIILKEENSQNQDVISNLNIEIERLTKRVRKLEDVVNHGNLDN